MPLTVAQAFPAGMFLFVVLFFLLLSLLSLAVSVYMVYWTYRDATKRGMDNPELWAIIVFFGNIMGLVAYLVVRE